ncbi:ABC transporter substrate-binding protein [Steroidobacter sp.]|uniref:ABC transporter substrate-binding protein n=1 Tax=Steroidobacter sp. TaxID=1978227 RepID=UPI001A3B6A45|nr:helical backbone metal receptor [Steroidobacter sp.]MBL8265249.1 ABC transporter substrate-binding protein [Steroidobacter sp.]
MSARWLVFVLLLAAAPALLADAAPRSIVSINTCLDPILLELVSKERIAALSRHSKDPLRSAIADIAKELPTTRESAEEIVLLKPDLVLASRHTAALTRNALQRVGVQLELFEIPRSVDASLAQVQRLAELVHEPERGRALVERIKQAIEHARPAVGTRGLSAVIYQPSGMSAGKGTITDELMRIAGLSNVATQAKLTGYRVLPLESLLGAAPDIVLLGDTLPGSNTRAEKMVHHRALRALQPYSSFGTFPARYMNCAGPVMIAALDTLVAARERSLANFSGIHHTTSEHGVAGR